MKAVILAGGEGTRLRPLTFERPKPVVPVVNHPLLGHIINWLRKHRITEIILSTCYKPAKLKAVFCTGSDWGVQIRYVMEKFPLGTGGALKNTEKYIDETTVVINGDILCDIDLSEMLRQHRQRKAFVTIALVPVDNPSAYGLVRVDSHRRVRQFLEKPEPEQIGKSHYINAGIYIVEPGINRLMPAARKVSMERQVFPKILRTGQRFFAFCEPGVYWLDLGTPEKYLKAQADILSGRLEAVTGGKKLNRTVLAGRRCVIAPGVRFQGAVVMGNRCKIDKGAVLKNCILWDNVRIGAGSRISRTIIASQSNIGEHCRIKDSVFGSGSRISHRSHITGR